ncbi:unnamed protein product [Chrysodeixis includens]|uniref:Uncharacterized protein n=1 Tax=Chrysodeixis includens TaxID=689277 RepID=A0A9N8PZB0_CHRIL|nr:unnamed protein product [Chrysodeixis includens]
MTMENLFSQMGMGTKQLSERYSDVPVHDHHVYYAYEPSGPSHGHIASSKHNYGGSHKSSASMSALTLLAFLFFLHILQQCIKDHVTDMSTAPIMIMTAGREGEEAIPKSSAYNKIDKTGVTQIDSKNSPGNDQMIMYNSKKVTEKSGVKKTYDDSSSNKNQIKIKSANASKLEEQTKRIFKNVPNRNPHFAGFVSAMDEE